MSNDPVIPATALLEPAGDWPPELQKEFRERQLSGCVGHILVSESGRVRVWSLRLRPGERLPFHRHVLDYFWTATTPGKARSRYPDGHTSEPEYEAGDTMHFTFASGEFMVHDLENIGSEDLCFTTVEFLDSANPPLEIPDAVRRRERTKY
jgi:hypothetical protein